MPDLKKYKYENVIRECKLHKELEVSPISLFWRIITDWMVVFTPLLKGQAISYNGHSVNFNKSLITCGTTFPHL